MYKQARDSLKKYFGTSSIISSNVNNSSNISIKPEPNEAFFVKPEEFESYMTWKNKKNNTNQNYSNNNNYGLKKNFLGKNGLPVKCYICQSIYHLARTCPEKKRNRYSSYDRTTYYVNSNEVNNCYVSEPSVGESFNYMILDTGSPQNVAGRIWTDCFLNSLDEDMTKKVLKERSNRWFKFGNMNHYKSLYTVPVMIGGTVTSLQFDVVEKQRFRFC